MHLFFLLVGVSGLGDCGYSAGIRNFFRLYLPLASTWTVYNNSGPEPVCVAEGLSSETIGVYDKDVWETIKRQGTI